MQQSGLVANIPQGNPSGSMGDEEYFAAPP
jgi:hypothetical protein